MTPKTEAGAAFVSWWSPRTDPSEFATEEAAISAGEFHAALERDVARIEQQAAAAENERVMAVLIALRDKSPDGLWVVDLYGVKALLERDAQPDAPEVATG